MSSTKHNPLTLESLPLANNANQLDSSLSWIGATGLAFTITNSWMSYAATFGTALTNGGGITVLLSVLIAGFAQWIVLLGVCEMVSAIPSSGVHPPTHPRIHPEPENLLAKELKSV